MKIIENYGKLGTGRRTMNHRKIGWKVLITFNWLRNAPMAVFCTQTNKQTNKSS